MYIVVGTFLLMEFQFEKFLLMVATETKNLNTREIPTFLFTYSEVQQLREKEYK